MVVVGFGVDGLRRRRETVLVVHMPARPAPPLDPVAENPVACPALGAGDPGGVHAEPPGFGLAGLEISRCHGVPLCSWLVGQPRRSQEFPGGSGGAFLSRCHRG